MPRGHAITADELALLAAIGFETAAHILDQLTERGLRIARRPGRPRVRDAGTGRYVDAGRAERDPRGTVTET